MTITPNSKIFSCFFFTLFLLVANGNENLFVLNILNDTQNLQLGQPRDETKTKIPFFLY